MGKVLLLFFCLSAVSFGAENVLLIAGGYEGSDRNFIFNNIAHALARTLSARGWEASAIYGEPGHADQHRREFAADGPVNHVPFSLESLRARIQELVRGEGPAQLLLHLGGHGTIENGRYRIQIGADTYLNASELAELLRPLLAKGVKVAMTLDSCSSGQLIENLADSLGALTRNLCTVASTNRQPYVSSRGILGPMMGSSFSDECASRCTLCGHEKIFFRRFQVSRPGYPWALHSRGRVAVLRFPSSAPRGSKIILSRCQAWTSCHSNCKSPGPMLSEAVFEMCARRAGS